MSDSYTIRVCGKFGKAIEKLAKERRWSVVVTTDELTKNISMLIPYLAKVEEEAV